MVEHVLYYMYCSIMSMGMTSGRSVSPTHCATMNLCDMEIVLALIVLIPSSKGGTRVPANDFVSALVLEQY